MNLELFHCDYDTSIVYLAMFGQYYGIVKVGGGGMPYTSVSYRAYSHLMES